MEVLGPEDVAGLCDVNTAAGWELSRDLRQAMPRMTSTSILSMTGNGVELQRIYSGALEIRVGLCGCVLPKYLETMTKDCARFTFASSRFTPPRLDVQIGNERLDGGGRAERAEF